MKTEQEIKKILTSIKPDLYTRYSVKQIGIFGSYLSGNQKESSDIDTLAEYGKPVSLIEFVNLKNYLTDLLEIDVDLVMKKALKPNLGRRILREVVYV
jgi:predicted nucleotidyltransferase